MYTAQPCTQPGDSLYTALQDWCTQPGDIMRSALQNRVQL